MIGSLIIISLACKARPADSYTNYDLIYGDEFAGLDVSDIRL